MTRPKDWCEELKRLDAQYKTDPKSPLHHDQRCPIHGTRRARR